MKRYLGVALSVILIAAVAIVAIFVAGNKAEKAVAAVAESHIDQVASAEADAASIRAQAQADADAIRAQAQADAEEIRAEAEVQVEEEEAFFFKEAESDEVEDESAFEQVTVDGQQVFVGDQESVIDYLSSLDRQTWLDLAVIDREGDYYARVLPWQVEVIRNGAFVSAYRMTSNLNEYTVLRNGALLVQDANGQVVVDYNTTKVSGINDKKYPRQAYAAEAEALYEGYVKAATYTKANAYGSLKVSCGFDRQEIFNALVVAEGDFWCDGGYIHGYFVAWRIVEGPARVAVVTNPPHNPTTPPTTPPATQQPTAQPTTEPTAQPTTEPTTKPTTEPTAQPTVKPTPAHSTPEPNEQTPAHSIPDTDSSTPEHSTPSGDPSHTTPTGDFVDSHEDPIEVMGEDREPAKPDNGSPSHTEATGDFVDSHETVSEVMDRPGDAPRHAPVADDGSSQQVSSSITEIDAGLEARHAAVADSTTTCVVVEQETVEVEHSAPTSSEDDFTSSDDLLAFWN